MLSQARHNNDDDDDGDDDTTRESPPTNPARMTPLHEIVVADVLKDDLHVAASMVGVAADDDMSDLVVALMPFYATQLPWQHAFQTHHMTRLLFEANAYLRRLLSTTHHLVTANDLRRDARALRSMDISPESNDDLHEDDANRSHKRFAREAERRSATAADDLSRVNERTHRLHESFWHLLTSDGRDGAKLIDDNRRSIERMVRLFPMTATSRGLEGTIAGIAQRGGRPRVIVFYGHANNNAFQSHYGDGNNRVDARRFVAAIETLPTSPKCVVFVGCVSHALARAATELRGDLCWLGSTSNLDRNDLYTGNKIFPRWLNTLLQIYTLLKLGVSRVRFSCADGRFWSSGILNAVHRCWNDCAIDKPTGYQLWCLMLMEMIDLVDCGVDELLIDGHLQAVHFKVWLAEARQDPLHVVWACLREETDPGIDSN